MNEKLSLMERAGEQMFVPSSKVQAFEADGWRAIQSPTEPVPEAAKPVEPQAEVPVFEEVVEKTARRKAAKK